MTIRNRVARHAAGFTLVEILLALTLIVLLVMLVLPNFIQARKRSAYSVCGENLKSLAVALQSYANDYGQVYPPSLSALAPAYIEAVPTCPSSGSGDTYSPGYEKGVGAFTVLCKGFAHCDVAGVGQDQPVYTVDRGLRP